MPHYAAEFEATAENGIIRLPAEYPELANARLLVLVAVEPQASTPVGRTDWAKLAAAYADFEGHDPYPAITDAAEWQRQLRADDERELDR